MISTPTVNLEIESFIAWDNTSYKKARCVKPSIRFGS